MYNLNNFGVSPEGKTPYKRIESVFNSEAKSYGTDFITRVSNINRYYPQTDKWDLRAQCEKIAMTFGLYIWGNCESYDSMWEFIDFKTKDGDIVASLIFA